MAATAQTSPVASSASDPDHGFRVALQELLQMGLRVAAVAATLADAEKQAIGTLAAAAKEAARVVVQPDSLSSAIEIGRIGDISEATRDAAAARVALITTTFERAARAVRRTVALARRIQDARPFYSPAANDSAATPVARTPYANTAERLCDDLADRFDPAEFGDELGCRPTVDIVRGIRRDLDRAELPDQIQPAAAPDPGRWQMSPASIPNRARRRTPAKQVGLTDTC